MKPIIVNNPIISHNLSIIRAKDTNSENFRLALKKIAYALMYEASKYLPTVKKTVETPLEKISADVFDNSMQLILAPILRAGLIFLDIAMDFFPFANVHHIGMYRDEKTLEPVWYYDKNKFINKDKNKVYLIILDPMLATGNSGIDTIDNFIKKGIKEENIIFVSLISSPVGVDKMYSKFPKIKIITSAYDKGLNSKGYILPGLGDAGDRIYNTL